MDFTLSAGTISNFCEDKQDFFPSCVFLGVFQEMFTGITLDDGRGVNVEARTPFGQTPEWIALHNMDFPVFGNQLALFASRNGWARLLAGGVI